MILLSDGIRAQRFPIVNVALIVANFGVWIFYELPHLNSAVYDASFYPCAVSNACHAPQPWELSWFTAMFLHGSWDHTLATCCSWQSSARTSRMPLGDCATSPSTSREGSSPTRPRPRSRCSPARPAPHGCRCWAPAERSPPCSVPTSCSIRTPACWDLLVVFPIRIPAWVFLGVWFVYQLIEANYGLTSPHANESGVAFFAHVGGFIFGMIVARALLSQARSSGAQTLPRGSPSHVSS